MVSQENNNTCNRTNNNDNISSEFDDLPDLIDMNNNIVYYENNNRIMSSYLDDDMPDLVDENNNVVHYSNNNQNNPIIYDRNFSINQNLQNTDINRILINSSLHSGTNIRENTDINRNANAYNRSNMYFRRRDVIERIFYIINNDNRFLNLDAFEQPDQ